MYFVSRSVLFSYPLHAVTIFLLVWFGVILPTKAQLQDELPPPVITLEGGEYLVMPSSSLDFVKDNLPNTQLRVQYPNVEPTQRTLILSWPQRVTVHRIYVHPGIWPERTTGIRQTVNIIGASLYEGDRFIAAHNGTVVFLPRLGYSEISFATPIPNVDNARIEINAYGCTSNPAGCQFSICEIDVLSTARGIIPSQCPSQLKNPPTIEWFWARNQSTEGVGTEDLRGITVGTTVLFAWETERFETTNDIRIAVDNASTPEMNDGPLPGAEPFPRDCREDCSRGRPVTFTQAGIYTYVLTANGPGGWETAEVRIEVVSDSTAEPSCVLTASPQQGQLPFNLTLAWSVVNANSCGTSQGDSLWRETPIDLSRTSARLSTHEVSELTNADLRFCTDDDCNGSPCKICNYGLICTGDGGSNGCEIPVAIITAAQSACDNPPQVVQSGVTPSNNVLPGASVNIEWRISNANTVAITEGGGTVTSVNNDVVTTTHTAPGNGSLTIGVKTSPPIQGCVDDIAEYTITVAETPQDTCTGFVFNPPATLDTPSELQPHAQVNQPYSSSIQVVGLNSGERYNLNVECLSGGCTALATSTTSTSPTIAINSDAGFPRAGTARLNIKAQVGSDPNRCGEGLFDIIVDPPPGEVFECDIQVRYPSDQNFITPGSTVELNPAFTVVPPRPYTRSFTITETGNAEACEADQDVDEAGTVTSQDVGNTCRGTLFRENSNALFYTAPSQLSGSQVTAQTTIRMDKNGDGNADAQCNAQINVREREVVRPPSGGGQVVACDHPTDSIENFLNCVIGTIIQYIGVAAFLAFVVGGVTYLTAAGNADRINLAKRMLFGAITGLAIAFVSYAALRLVIATLGGV